MAIAGHRPLLLKPRLLLHNALRVDEACAADVADLGEDRGHRVLRVVREGGRSADAGLVLR